jgi:predicted RNA-binding Zn-ribbon protein involved in translation (DUF1610 family)
MFTCRNQPCGANWEVSDVDIHNEGQGLLFRCPQCGARNRVIRHEAADGAVTYEQDDSVPVKSEAASPAKNTPRSPVRTARAGKPAGPLKSTRGSNAGRNLGRSPGRTPTKRGR